jgi:hypothetical protein
MEQEWKWKDRKKETWDPARNYSRTPVPSGRWDIYSSRNTNQELKAMQSRVAAMPITVLPDRASGKFLCRK